MFLNTLILAISSSIDSLGIGITYGIKNTKISHIAKVILFSISFFTSLISIYFGNIIKTFFSQLITKFLGSIFLILIGLFICFESIKNDSKKKNKDYKDFINIESEKVYSFFIKCLGLTIKIIKNPTNSDLDNSNSIDSKEAILLGITLSLDCFCIGIGGNIVGINNQFFPFFIAFFQLILLSFGNSLGKKFYKTKKIPDNIWSIISGIILIIIGFFRFL